MPPSGPRQPQSSNNPNVRNQVFENIFGRSAHGHHLATQPPQQQYVNPAQPSYPPSMPYHPTPPPQSQAPPQPQPTYPMYRPAPARRPDLYDGVEYLPNGNEGRRRSSLAPSNYSAASSPSVYSPNSDISPPQPAARLPPTAFPTPKPRLPSGPTQAFPAGAMTPAQAYQASQGHPSSSVVFPRPSTASPAIPAQATPNIGTPFDPSSSVTSFSTTNSATSRIPTSTSITSFHKPTSQSPSLAEMSKERSATPDYIGKMGQLAFESSPAENWMDDVTGISVSPDDSRNPVLPPKSQHGHGALSHIGRASMHKRMASDSSILSGDNATKMGFVPLSPAASPTYDTVSSPTTPTGDMSFHARASTDSTVSLPLPLHTTESLPPGARRGYENRSTSFSGSSREVIRPLSNPAAGLSNPQGQIQTRAPLPSLYPALLSLVSAAFKSYIPLADLTKDGITYKDSFSGQAAVTLIAELIKTSDRNLALLLGRSLDAQKFFHDVTYDHRLRDNPKEVYRFRDRLAAPFTDTNGNGESSTSEERLTRNGSGASSTGMGFGGGLKALTAARAADSSSSMHTESAPVSTTPSRSSTMPFPDSESPDSLDSEDSLPVGVFTLLTDCYSPTCSRDSLCYSINCPRRLEQMKRLNMKPEPGLNRKLSRESLVDVKETGTLWIHSVSQEILDSVGDKEKKRQEAINEVIYTERDFVRDLEYLRDSWVKPLRTQDVIDAKRRDDFVRQVFWNVHDVLSVNHVLAERLTKRQKKEPVVSRIGDIFLERVPLFEPFVTYGAHQLFGKYEFEKEKGANAVFQKFVDDTERKPESRKLELNGYLTKPTTRLGRYPLLLEAVLKYTPDDHPDKEDLPEVIKMIKGFLTKVNAESGKSENIFELAQIEQQLVFRPNERIDLRLRDKNRQLVHKGPLKRRGGNREEIADLLGFLFDHAFLLVKPKWVNKSEQYKVYRRPIPLELLVLITPDEQYNSGKLSYGNARSRLITRHPNSKTNHVSQNNSITAPPKPESKHGFSLTILHLGKKGYSMQLWVDTHIGRKKWLECIDKQQGMLREKSTVFVSETITEGILSGVRKVNCSSPYDQGNRMIFGTDEGVYFANLRDEKLREPVKVINLIDVTQVDVIEEFQLLIVLHERCVTTFPLDSLDPSDPNAALKRGKRISSHTSFIKSGICLGKTLVAIVKSSTLSSTIKVMEPVDLSQNRKKTQAGFMRRLNGKDDALKLFKEFYIPTESSSVHFLKTKLCVGCTKGFEIVDLETLDMQGLLDPSDGSLDFVLKRDNVRPIAIYRIEEDFLLCYDEFAFYVNKNGWRSRPKWAIVWEGVPTSFALQYPYVIAFEPTFIEVHHVETGHLVQIIPGNNIQCLFADTPPSRVNAPLPPNRMMYLPPTPGAPPYTRPPNLPGYTVYPNMSYPGHPQQPRQPSNGAYPPHLINQPPDARVRHPPQTPMGYGMPSPHPPPLINRFARPQVVFVSDDSHVQFLKFPPASHSHLQRPVITHHQTAPAGHSAKSSR
ncbi:rho guanyl-nucleotide exchange factor [Cryptococcus deuterogattii LA55]|nr:rho guanyl-nucleotide exchange factor [Cryptococcus deuterogattii LA55]KIR91491.1 rho guanyl-nucleotide exchange factor [Cryptococcus deuterogattii CBS 10090]